MADHGTRRYLWQVAYFTPDKNPPPAGALDRFVRRFSATAYAIAVLGLYVIAATALGVAAAPSLWLVHRYAPALWHAATPGAFVLLGLLLGAALFLWGFALMVVVPIYNVVLPTRLRPFKGGYFTGAAVPWYVHNGLFYLVRFTFLPFATLTPLATVFFRAMGMKMGKRPRISTENFSDPGMIELGDDVVIGGSARVFCHYGGGGHLVIAPVRIGSRATVGLLATVMGDVEVGEGAVILPHSVVLPGSRIPAGARWGGVPARPVSDEEWERYKALTRGPGTADA